MRCPSCGIQNAIKNGFCTSCGAAYLDDEHHPRLGPYLLLEKIGEGGMGIVYRARDERNGNDVAIKVLHPHLLKHENLKERFRREARVHGRLRHPNIVTLLDLYEDGEHMALVMEMVHGRNLRQFLAERPQLSLRDVLEIADKVLEGLQASHQAGVVHRDIKPGNVLLTEKGEVKLMDFGLAKPQSGEDDLTKSGVTVGSFRYMAPEQILNQRVDVRSDLYSFGILLYEMCTGRLPFDATGDGAGEFEIMEKQVRETPVEPRKLNRALPRALSELIMELLSKDPAKRPADCEAVRQRLHEICEQAEGRLGSPLKRTVPAKQPEAKRTAPAASPRPARTPHPLRLWLVFLLLMAAGGGIAYLWLESPPRTSTPAPMKQPALEPAASPTAPIASPTKPTESRPAEKASPRPTPPKKGIAPSPAASKASVRSLTYRQPHRLIRFDGTQSDMRHAHEFRGGTRVFFPDLEQYRWKEKLHTYKQGWVRLSFQLPTAVSTIVIRRASVGDRDFRGGSIKLRVVNSRGQSRQLLDRRDRDIDRPLTLPLPSEWRNDVKVVEIRFRSAEPITIGPIDLLP